MSDAAATERAIFRRACAVLSELQDENVQLREALLAGGRLDQVAAMRDEFEIPMLPAELVGVDVSAWFRSVLLSRGPS